jgi:hypothetical protein
MDNFGAVQNIQAVEAQGNEGKSPTANFICVKFIMTT